ncbi:MAG: hypothetical protein QG608_906 [Actinomycetota bacterium]|nr:hypothetical protein [Actinomycetota bacterium]
MSQGPSAAPEERKTPGRTGPRTRTGPVALAGGVVVGLGVPLALPFLGVPFEDMTAQVVLACLAVTLVVTWIDVIFMRWLAGKYVGDLASGVEAVAKTLRHGVQQSWQSGNLRELRIPENSDGELGRASRAVNELIEALEAERAFRSIVDASGDLVLLLDDTGQVAFSSKSVTKILGWTAGELHQQPLAAFVHAGDIERFAELIDAEGDPPAESDRPRLRLRSQDGSWRVMEWAVSVRGDRELGKVLLTGRDVTDQVEVERELLHQAHHDPLTGLPNRKALMQISHETVITASADRPVAVLMIDLDRFKDVNDSLGHAVGDKLLSQVGQRLRSILRPGDTIARLGGDEFAVLLPMANESDARLVAERLAGQLEEPFAIDGMDLHVEASIGIAVSHRTGREEKATTETLFRESDIAMYRAKEGGTGIAIFDPDRDSGQSRSRLEMSAELRKAINENQLILHYQPVVDVLQGRLAGVEALVRWQHPERGLMAPGEFLPLAEQTGLIVPLSKWVMAKALGQAALWLGGGRPLQIAVNMSPRWLQNVDVPDIVASLLAETEVSPSLLRLEITESVVLADPEETLPMLNRLRRMGIGLSLDDFGTGYSSMTHLRNLPVDEVKVDRAFVQAMTSSPEDAVIVRAAIELGHNLGMSVVAEGIEDADTLAEIVASGCSLAQGYYFSRPLPPEELMRWAQERFPYTPEEALQHDVLG